MKNLDLKNPEHSKQIQDILRAGVNTEFWDIIKQRLESTIDSLQDQLDSDMSGYVAEEYKIRNEVLKAKKLDRKDILELPRDLVKELDNPDFFKQDREEEVYDTAKTLEETIKRVLPKRN